MTSSETEGTVPHAKLLSPSNLILRLKRPRFDDLYPCPAPPPSRALTKAALEYRRTIMAYDYMESRGTEYDNPNASWAKMLALRPRLAPLHFQFQRGRGKMPKVTEVLAIGDIHAKRAIGERLLDIAAGRTATKKPHFFDRAIWGRNPREDVVGWLDLQNNFCWFTDCDMWRATIKFLGCGGDAPFRVQPYARRFVLQGTNHEIITPVPLSDPLPGVCSLAEAASDQSPAAVS